MSNYPQQQQVFSFSPPNYYYGEDQQWQSDARYTYDDMSAVPRTPYVDPQALQVGPSLSPLMEDYGFPQPTLYSSMFRSATENEEFMDYDMASNQRRQRPTTTATWTQNQYPKYAIDRTNSRSNGYGHHGHSLPTPPSSPTSTIPLSAISTSSSASSSAAMSRTMTTNNNSTTGTHHANTSRSSSSTSRSHQHQQQQQQQQQQSQPKHSSSTSTSASSTSARHFCTHPSCLDTDGRPIRSFSRRADLQRHHACEHDSPVRYSCPRPNCIRKGTNGFTRQDHLVEHRRGYHGESIPKRGQRSSASPDSTGSSGGRAEGRRRK